jgi:hypothetical protein
MDKMQIISNYVRQSYDIFNTFGKSTASLENICLGFYQVLKDFDNSYINRAFTYWIENHSNMPTPAEIRKKCQDYKRWDAERDDLKQIGKARPCEAITRSKTVSWYLMQSDYFNKNKQTYLAEMREHKKHLVNFKGADQAKSYFNQYLNGYLGYQIRYEEL